MSISGLPKWKIGIVRAKFPGAAAAINPADEKVRLHRGGTVPRADFADSTTSSEPKPTDDRISLLHNLSPKHRDFSFAQSGYYFV
jgi:hypothetical protein